MTSIVIPLSAPLGFGSRQDDIELRYCLRSIEKHLTGYGDIFIVGHMPKWVQGCIHIPATDEDKTWNKERNIFNKIMLACNDERVTEDFLFMNDDHYLLKDYVAGEFPYYWSGYLRRESEREDQYGNTAKNTLKYLGSDYQYFDLHCPIVYGKSKIFFLTMPDWGVKYGYCIKTVYTVQNAIMSYPVDERLFGERYSDLKINAPFPSSKIRELIAGRHWFSIGNKAFEGGIMGVLNELYPKPSKYEK